MVTRSRIPDDTCVYAIGDIHGCARLLRKLHDAICEDSKKKSASRNVVVYLGDYIDRGPDSSGVVDLALMGPGIECECVYLKGNHEAMLLEFLDGVRGSQIWRMNGAHTTFRSYGVDADSEDRICRDALRAALSPTQTAFFRNLKLTHIEGDYLFVHAGLRPGRPLKNQDDADLMFIRNPFLDSLEDWGYTVVHGHTTVAEPDIRENRIDIDTGAVWTGRLTAMAFHGVTRDVIQT
jgi:serine/threonine protein phosphatase 1